MMTTKLCGAGGVTIGGLTADDVPDRRFAVLGGLLDPANPRLLDFLPSGARRLLVVAGRGVDQVPLLRYLSAQQRAGRLAGYTVAPPNPSDVDGPTLAGVLRLAEVAADAGLGRRDAFLAYGHGGAVTTAIAAAALFRRHTAVLHVVSDLPGVRAAADAADRVALAGPVTVTRRDVTLLVDRDMLLDGTAPDARADALRELSIVEDGWTPRIRTLSYRVEAVSDVVGPAPRPDRLAAWLPAGGRVLAVVDDFSPDVLNRVRDYLGRHHRRGLVAGFEVIGLTSTPAAKGGPLLQEILSAAGRMGCGPDDRIVAVGGGTVLDLVGTAALLYHGGTPYLRVPTTLVGMIDAGIGLKVGIDLHTRKNLLGGYHPPMACLCDPAFLRSLPLRDLRCGLAEMIKIAMVTDGELFGLIERHHEDLLTGRQSGATRQMMDRAVVAMLDQLAANPFERELRRLPDFGHEYGHQLESASRYRIRHGEAVAVGMALAGQLAALTGRLADRDHHRMLRLLTRVGLPVFDRLCTPDRLWAWLGGAISAHKGGEPRLVIPTAVGTGGFIDTIDALSPDLMRRACAALSGEAPDGRR